MSPAAAPARAPRRAPSRTTNVPSRAPSRPRRPDLYVVPPPARATPTPRRSSRSSGTGRLGIISVGLVFVVAFAIAVLQTVLVQGQMQLDDLQQQISAREAEAQRLRLEAATLASPANVVDTAESMGMVSAPGGPTFVPTVAGDGVPPEPDPPVDAAAPGQVAAPAPAGAVADPVP